MIFKFKYCRLGFRVLRNSDNLNTILDYHFVTSSESICPIFIGRQIARQDRMLDKFIYFSTVVFTVTCRYHTMAETIRENIDIIFLLTNKKNMYYLRQVNTKSSQRF